MRWQGPRQKARRAKRAPDTKTAIAWRAVVLASVRVAAADRTITDDVIASEGQRSDRSVFIQHSARYFSSGFGSGNCGSLHVSLLGTNERTYASRAAVPAGDRRDT